MSASTELQQQAQQIEYLLCIEGVGWLTDEATGPSGGFDGTLFATADLAGTLASDIGATIKRGLMLPGSVGETFDATTMRYQASGLDLEIVESAAYVLSTLVPFRTTAETTLATAITYTDTTIVMTDGGSFAEGDVIVLAGSESILLGSKSTHTFTGCTRGYLGTPIGKQDRDVLARASGFSVEAGAVIRKHHRFMKDKRVRLYAHKPGDAESGCLLLYSGKIADLTSDSGGTSWRVSTTGEQIGGGSEIRRNPVQWKATQVAYVYDDGGAYTPRGGQPASGGSERAPLTEIPPGMGGTEARIHCAIIPPASTNVWESEYNALRAWYPYRSEPGGTAGILVDFWTSAVQAVSLTGSNEDDAIDAYLVIDGKIYHAIKRMPGLHVHNVMLDVVNAFGEWHTTLETSAGRPLRFMLDNITDIASLSRFAINGEVRRNVVDVILMFLTSMNSEFVIGDSVAGGTTTNVIFADNALGAANQWAGYAIHCVEGSNKGQSRTIASNTAGAGNSVTVDRAFPYAAGGGDEYQIRNTMYDVLPLGWGLGVLNSKIDLDSFETVRDSYMAGVDVGKFMLGESEQINLLSLIIDNICIPYGLLLYVDRTTGKWSLRYVGPAYGDGVFSDYVSIANADIIAASDISYGLSKPLGAMTLKVRASNNVLSGINQTRTYRHANSMWADVSTEQVYADAQAPTIEGATTSITLRSRDAETLPSGAVNSITVPALLNSEDDAEALIGIGYGRLQTRQIGAPKISYRLPLKFIETIQAGVLVSITDAYTIDPYTSTVGMTARAGLVVASRIELSDKDPGVEAEIELLATYGAGKLAPAIIASSKSSDGNGEYLVCGTTDLVIDQEDDRDHYYFAVGDLVELRSITGALKEDLGAITGFGTNFAATPQAGTESAGTIRIYVDDASITSTIATGDYLTFHAYDSATNTARMNNYSAYADATEELATGIDAKVYA